MGIEVWAYLWSEAGVPDVRCSVDGNGVANQPAPTSEYEEWLDWQVVYDSNLSSGNHTIACSVVSASDDAPFFLKDFHIHPSDLPQLLAGGLADSAEPDASTTSSSATPSSTSTSQSGSSKKAAPVGAIVGGVLGGIALLALIVLVLELYLRRRRGRYAKVGGYDDDGA